ncbi:MAG: hypothetical protein Q9204_006408 [Flavoplaca sp. TL-2023a]
MPPGSSGVSGEFDYELPEITDGYQDPITLRNRAIKRKFHGSRTTSGKRAQTTALIHESLRSTATPSAALSKKRYSSLRPKIGIPKPRTITSQDESTAVPRFEPANRDSVAETPAKEPGLPYIGQSSRDFYKDGAVYTGKPSDWKPIEYSWYDHDPHRTLKVYQPDPTPSAQTPVMEYAVSAQPGSPSEQLFAGMEATEPTKATESNKADESKEASVKMVHEDPATPSSCSARVKGAGNVVGSEAGSIPSESTKTPKRFTVITKTMANPSTESVEESLNSTGSDVTDTSCERNTLPTPLDTTEKNMANPANEPMTEHVPIPPAAANNNEDFKLLVREAIDELRSLRTEVKLLKDEILALKAEEHEPEPKPRPRSSLLFRGFQAFWGSCWDVEYLT